MRQLILIVIILNSFLPDLKAQKLDMESINKRLSLDRKALYVINGMAYSQSDSLKLDSALKSYPSEHLLSVTMLKSDTLRLIQCSPPKDIAILYFATQQTKKEIHKRLHMIRRKTHKSTPQYVDTMMRPKGYSLQLNGKKVGENEVWSIVKSLKADKIYAIHDMDHPAEKNFKIRKYKLQNIVVWTKIDQHSR